MSLWASYWRKVHKGPSVPRPAALKALTEKARKLITFSDKIDPHKQLILLEDLEPAKEFLLKSGVLNGGDDPISIKRRIDTTAEIMENLLFIPVSWAYRDEGAAARKVLEKVQMACADCVASELLADEGRGRADEAAGGNGAYLNGKVKAGKKGKKKKRGKAEKGGVGQPGSVGAVIKEVPVEKWGEEVEVEEEENGRTNDENTKDNNGVGEIKEEKAGVLDLLGGTRTLEEEGDENQVGKSRSSMYNARNWFSVHSLVKPLIEFGRFIPYPTGKSEFSQYMQMVLAPAIAFIILEHSFTDLLHLILSF